MQQPTQPIADIRQHPRVTDAQRMFRAVAGRWAHDCLRLRASGLCRPSHRGWDGERGRRAA